MVAVLLYRIVIILAGVLYPAYSSFKAVRRKSHKDYTKWMMYWIVFALFQTAETFLDTFVSWMPLYYELKIGFVLWLVMPITEGSKQLYKVVIHPFLVRHEQRIDQHIAMVGQSSFRALRRLSQAGLNRAATTVLSSAIKGQAALAETLLRTQEGMNNGGTPETEGGTPETEGGRSSASPTGEGRASASSTDLEPFEVLDENSEEVYMSVQQGSDPIASPVDSSQANSDQMFQDFTESKKQY